jgi:UDP-N-acetylmuramoyl-tripeptide--D-alanyl-D-alanine ligase
MEAALKNFNMHFSGKRAVFLGDMLELGDSTIAEHKSVINLLKTFNFETIVLVGKNFLDAGIPEGMISFNTSREVADWAGNQDFENFNILIKGSRGSKMEVVMDGISGGS